MSTKRRCGNCTACCETHGVPEIEKPQFARCRHQCQAGCAIYTDRPAGCRAFECAWLQGTLNGEE